MADLRLEDFWGFIVAGTLLIVAGFGGLLIYVLWPQICLFVGALWRRYIAVGDWRAAMERLADERDGVRGYVEEGEASVHPALSERPGSYAGSQWVEPTEIPDASQLEPNDPSVREPSSDPIIIAHNMGRKELTIVLAAQKDGDGAYRFSANKIAEFVGGTSAEVKGWVADVRGKKEPAASSMRRPANGWGKAS